MAFVFTENFLSGSYRAFRSIVHEVFKGISRISNNTFCVMRGLAILQNAYWSVSNKLKQQTLFSKSCSTSSFHPLKVSVPGRRTKLLQKIILRLRLGQSGGIKHVAINMPDNLTSATKISRYTFCSLSLPFSLLRRALEFYQSNQFVLILLRSGVSPSLSSTLVSSSNKHYSIRKSYSRLIGECTQVLYSTLSNNLL